MKWLVFLLIYFLGLKVAVRLLDDSLHVEVTGWKEETTYGKY
jgi:hypothetical protein